jgi:AcrR family transcriptional regulator
VTRSTRSGAAGTRSRNARGQGARLRGELLAAATALMAAPRPVTPPSLRAVAKAAGVAPTAVYLHFDSGQALALAVVEELFGDLRREVDAADDPDADPVARLHLVGQALADWAGRRPAAYQLLFEAPDVAVGTDPSGKRVGPGIVFLEMVAHLLVLTGRAPADATVRALRVWVALHGAVSLRLHKPHAPWATALTEDVDELLEALR